MLTKYHRNAILMGYIDFYCLVCENHLRSEDDINGHIAKPIHSKNLEATGFFDKYKDECVRKVKKGYFCEFCNIMLFTAAKVGLHVEEKDHIINRGTQLLKRSGNSIAYHDILINDKAWNGLIDDTCAICNAEFDNEDIHKTEIAHILNLVQNKVEFGADKSIYRKIDEGSFQCLTCNMVLGMNTITTHFNEQLHKNLYQDCRQANFEPDLKSQQFYKESQNYTPKTTNIEEKPAPVKAAVIEQAPLDLTPKLTDQQKDTVKKEVPVVSAKKQEVSKKPTTPTEPKKIEIPIETNKTEKATLHKATEELDAQICKALDAKDYITHDEHGNKWCLLCDWTMDSCVIFNHVNGRHHQTMLKLHKARLQNKNKSMNFENNVTKVEKQEKEHPQKETAEQKNRAKILDSVTEFQKNDVNINFESNTAVCKKCLKYLDFNVHSIESHIEDHKKNPPKKESSKPTTSNQKQDPPKKEFPKPTPVATQKQDEKKTQAKEESKKAQAAKRIEEERAESRASSVASNKENDEEVEKFAKANDLAYNRGGSKVYCRVCDSRVPASLKNMTEHVAGSHHKIKTAKWFEHKQSTKPVTIKTSMQEFIKNIVAVESDYMKSVIINERYCINMLSFFMITCLDRLRCEPCKVNLSFEQLDNHKASINHQRAMCETVVIASMESEFIREVRPDVFHCGYCNLTEEGPDLLTHLGSTSHREAKTAGSWHLQQFSSEILHQRQKRQELEMLMLLKMMISGEFF